MLQVKEHHVNETIAAESDLRERLLSHLYELIVPDLEMVRSTPTHLGHLLTECLAVRQVTVSRTLRPFRAAPALDRVRQSGPIGQEKRQSPEDNI